MRDSCRINTEEAQVKKKRYSEVQIFGILKEIESGELVVNAAREHGVSPATIHRWKSQYAGMSSPASAGQ